MFKALLKTRLSSMFFQAGTKNKKKKKSSGIWMKILFAILAVYVVGFFGAMFGFMFWGLATILPADGGWVYFALAAIISFLFMVIGSVFTAKNQLYEAKDNELLVSMPIPPSYIIATRVLALLILSYAFEALIMIPAFAVYVYFFGTSVVSVILFFLCFILLGIFSLAIIAALAFLIALLTRKVKNKSLFTMIFSFGFLALYFAFYQNVDKIITFVASNIGQIQVSLGEWGYPAYWFGLSVANGETLAFLAFALFCILPFVLVYIILSKSFVKLVTSSHGVSKVKYKEKRAKVSTPRAALVKKELKTFFSLPIYMMNCGLGTVFSIGASIFIVLKAKDITAYLPLIGSADHLFSIIISFSALLFSMNIVSAPSVSLEGSRLWIVKSLPVSPSEILFSKVLAHNVICVPPAVITGVILWIGFEMSWYLGIVAVFLPVLFSVFLGYCGVLVNLKLPKLSWINETIPIKQGAATLVTMLIGFGVSAAIILPVLFVKIIPATVFLTVICGLLALTNFLLHYILKNHTSRSFLKLGNGAS